MPKIAVTGAAGQIGSKLCEDLAKDHEITRIDIRGVDRPVSVLDLAALEKAIAGSETVIHLAGHVDVKARWEETHENLVGTYNVFEAARRGGSKRVIFASSNHAVGMYEVHGSPAIYEPANGMLLRTDVAIRPDGLYGVWKAFGENLGRYYSDEFGLKVACLRIGAIRKDDTPTPTDCSKEATWLKLTDDEKAKRMKAVWMSQRDLARLIRAIMASELAFGLVYGVGDNTTRFWDLEAGRTLYGFWPVDGVK